MDVACNYPKYYYTWDKYSRPLNPEKDGLNERDPLVNIIIKPHFFSGYTPFSWGPHIILCN
jgi:hypothetical protein